MTIPCPEPKDEGATATATATAPSTYGSDTLGTFGAGGSVYTPMSLAEPIEVESDGLFGKTAVMPSAFGAGQGDDGFSSNFGKSNPEETEDIETTSEHAKASEDVDDSSSSSSSQEEEGDNRTRNFIIITVCFVIMGIIFFVLKLLGIEGDDSSSSHYTSTGSSGYTGSRGGGGGSCFPRGEMVQIVSRGESKYVPIELLEPGSTTKEGGTVTAVLKLLPDPDQDVLYRYNQSAWVTGSHSVFESDGGHSNEKTKLLLVEDSVLSKAVPLSPAGFWDPRRDFLYNLVTSAHRVSVNGTLFADWDERDYCLTDMLRHLNGDPSGNLHHDVGDHVGSLFPSPSVGCPSGSHRAGSFPAGTMVSRAAVGSTNELSAVPIETLEPGDVIEGGTVLAVVRVRHPAGVALYRRASGVLSTEWSVVKDSARAKSENGSEWRFVQESADAVRVRSLASDEVFYQLITSSHVIWTADGSAFSDYEVVDDATVGAVLF